MGRRRVFLPALHRLRADGQRGRDLVAAQATRVATAVVRLAG
jgi:hypothetical protein